MGSDILSGQLIFSDYFTFFPFNSGDCSGDDPGHTKSLQSISFENILENWALISFLDMSYYVITLVSSHLIQAMALEMIQDIPEAFNEFLLKTFLENWA